ncbi:hypothetical protein [Candidatus Magnetobacterium casense]|uniref:Uncharacterized protein n=1 Tax=Candidatus Magnetobacterium casense TaxID=1455061 RepID=A0ABS6S0C0_9BACT|nr:hypothetical protein [Candidatus Magnetobacterium casensis]MBV6342025.1 hypothetical protein [Candidatus Magnetobacterium casensis]
MTKIQQEIQDRLNKRVKELSDAQKRRALHLESVLVNFEKKKKPIKTIRDYVELVKLQRSLLGYDTVQRQEVVPVQSLRGLFEAADTEQGVADPSSSEVLRR